MRYVKLLFIVFIFSSILISCSDSKTTNIIENKNISTPIQSNKNLSKLTTNTANITKPTSIKKINGFVNVLDIDNTLVIDLKYATKDNFTGIVLYNFNTCILREETALKIKKANDDLKKMGYRLKIYDGYRPVSVQKIMWEKASDKRYIANPYKKGSNHSRGCAVDVTIVDKNGKELEMPSKFDEFSIRASRKNTNMTSTERKNLDLLTKVMTKHGFTYINSEWWHFDDVNKDKYIIEKVDPKKFQSK
ncbi:MAG: M15 family metallopeptidase [Clostridiales bacterium]|nr:M15 family metallopeptidase [Clostridiales bacterium]